MNPDEQRTHKRATDKLNDRLENVETVVNDLGTWLAALRLELTAAQAAIHQLQTQQRIRNADDRLQALEWFRTGYTVWERLRWLLVGSR